MTHLFKFIKNKVSFSKLKTNLTLLSLILHKYFIFILVSIKFLLIVNFFICPSIIFCMKDNPWTNLQIVEPSDSPNQDGSSTSSTMSMSVDTQNPTPSPDSFLNTSTPIDVHISHSGRLISPEILDSGNLKPVGI
jgi:hypothetical protein